MPIVLQGKGFACAAVGKLLPTANSRPLAPEQTCLRLLVRIQLVDALTQELCDRQTRGHGVRPARAVDLRHEGRFEATGTRLSRI